jgi:hypothetical protein
MEDDEKDEEDGCYQTCQVRVALLLKNRGNKEEKEIDTTSIVLNTYISRLVILVFHSIIIDIKHQSIMIGRN